MVAFTAHLTFIACAVFGDAWISKPACAPDVNCDVHVSASSGNDAANAGGSISNPYRTIQYAVDQRRPGQTIHVLAGTYTNNGYGSGSNNNGPVVRLDGVSELTIKNYQNDSVIIRFDGAGGFVGGSTSQPVTHLEIAGMEIAGPNAQITYVEAMANRLVGGNYFGGRGIAIWSGHHIHIHDMLVHDCPNSGIRVNNGDYVLLENSEVYANTWWAPNAESGIVFATSKSVDELDIAKMIMRGNTVHDNINKVPYYNPNYAWDYSPIGSEDCSSYPECEAGNSSCPWTCRYGKAYQDYIIDGMGVYVTRNKDTYPYGKMELSANIAYRNGINGVVFHRTNRGIVKDNIVFDNGVVPKDGHTEPEPQDWHACCPGKGRQPYSGLILNEAEEVEMSNNSVAARYSDDYAYQMQMDGGTKYPVTGVDNNVCAGLDSLTPSSVVVRPGPCSENGDLPERSDVPNTWMQENGKECATWEWGMQKNCNKNSDWIANKYCELSCYNAGNGYADADPSASCCALQVARSSSLKSTSLASRKPASVQLHRFRVALRRHFNA